MDFNEAIRTKFMPVTARTFVMRKISAIFLVAALLLCSACLSDSPAASPSPGPESGVDRTEGVDESLRQELIDRESERVREMLEDRDYDEFGVGGGVSSFDVSMLNTSNNGRYVEVVIPYTYTKTTTPSDPDGTATPVELTADAAQRAVYFVNETTIQRKGTTDG